MDDIKFRISTVNVGQTNAATAAAAAVIPVSSTKYAVDESLFDALVDQATGAEAEAEAETETNGSQQDGEHKVERTLRQRLLEAAPEDIEYLAKLVGDRIAEGDGEIMLEIGGNAGEFSMDLVDDSDVAGVGRTLELVGDHPSVGAFANLLYDSGCQKTAGVGSGAGGDASSAGNSATYARDIGAVVEGSSGGKKKTRQGGGASEQSAGISAAQTGRTAVFLLRRKPSGVEQMLEVRVAVVGNVDAGKSTMLG
ncbi:hypothetical protein LPJ75_002769, partial [Coemansia sp. RSA 2598]